MTQGSNYPLHITLPFDYNLFRDFRITFSQQGAELNSWYAAWLDAPETGIVPEKPDFLR